MVRKGAHGFKTPHHEPSKTPWKLDVDSKETRTNVLSNMRLEEKIEKEAGS
jgi:hypothetical protein